MASRQPSRSSRTGRSPLPARERTSRALGRSTPSAGVRQVLSGHEGDLAGLALLALAVVIGLGVYADVAGPVGHGLRWLTGALVGVGRYAVPPVLAAIGVALVRRRPSAHRARAAIGGALGGLAVLGILHVARGPKHGAAVNAVRRAGGVVGLAVGRPLQALVASAGAVIILVAVVLAALLLLTQASLRAVAAATAKGVVSGVRPALGAARRAVGEMSTLASERRNGQARGELVDTTVVGATPAPPLYDIAAEDEPSSPTSRAGRKKSTLPPPDPFAAVPALPAGPAEQLAIDLGPGVQKGHWKLPPANLLTRTAAQQINQREVDERGEKLLAALTSHGVETTSAGAPVVGPTVTRYELKLGAGVKVAQVTSLHKDIAYAMASADVRILAPIPGKEAIGIEVPNHTRHLVSLGDILASPEGKTSSHPLDVAVGRDIAGRGVMMNLATMPHLLIAGATGAGKSSGINCLVTSILMRTTPDQVRLILIDPKRVEMGQYNRLPHLLTQVVTHPKKAANALQWAVKEMERRYDLLHEVGTRDITGYNAAFDRGELVAEPGSDKVFERLPFIVVVVDELNDLMMIAARDVEDSITRIAQMARAVGVHLVIATQRPSVNVLTGVIKANVPARMAFAVSSLTDSRVILDQPGAERLVGQGDMLLLGPASNVAQRIQGAFVSEEEVRKVTAHWRRQAPEVTYVSGVEEAGEREGLGPYGAGGGGGDDEDDESLLRQAMDLVVRSQLGSTSMLQRKLKVGFARAGRLMDLLEQRGVVGPSEGSKARSVLMSVEELELLQRAEQDG